MTTPVDNTLSPTDRKDDFEHSDTENVDAFAAAPDPTYDPNAAIVNEDEDFVEGGLRGWLVVVGSSIFSALVIGWPFSWGVFQAYYFEHNTFPGASETMLSWLGSVQSGIMPIISIFSGKLGDRYGYKPFVITGSIISCLGLLFAAFPTTLWQHFITQGILPGLAVGLMYPMVVSYPSMWFKQKRALTSGIVVAFAAFGGGVTSLLIRAMLTNIGLRNTLLVYFAINTTFLSTACFLVKSRGPSKQRIKIEWIDRALLKDPVFWSLALGMLFAIYGYVPPIFLMTIFTMEKCPNISSQLSVAPASVMNFSSGFGRILVGFLADRVGLSNAFFASLTVAVIAQLVLWNLAEGYTMIMVFSVVVGASSGNFLSLLAPMIAEIYGTQKLATLSGLLSFFNLPGSFSGAPLATAILSASGSWHAAISFSGGAQIISAGCFLYARLKRRPRSPVI
ncbi:hypothetical protein FRB94_011223 [Tulasnella sp. JGI-2019a]|nr:hypothetical protein FRB93_002397 [Tulasnella sp. JGI-2019a]KAG9009941.1 hypothetical protein FRB94_011223 [Tulasnella sp. JGI-2019a]